MSAYRGVLKARISKLYGGDVTVEKARKLKARPDATPRDKQLANWFINMQTNRPSSPAKSKSFSLEGFTYDMKKPPKDNSLKTFSEIKEISKIKNDVDFVKKRDDIKTSFKEAFKNTKIEYPSQLVDDMIKESSKIIKKFKNKFNRPRPKVVAKNYNIKLKDVEMSSMKTPSYPSGHSAQAYLVGGKLADMFPELKSKLDKIAKEISYSRNVAKAHFPSDSDEGEKLGVAMLNFKSSPAKRKDPVVGTGKKPKGSGRRLYTDENPKDTVSIKFATVKDAKDTIAKVKNINKPYARKVQILTVLEQRAKVMGKMEQARLAKSAKLQLKRQKKEG